MITLKNDIIRLRALESEDIDLLYKWENDQKLWSVSNTLTPFSRTILKKYIESSHHDIYTSKQLRLMIDVISENGFITAGSIDLFDFDPFNQRAGIGIFLEEQYRRKGVAASALQLLLTYCFKTLKLVTVYCNISSSNQESVRLFVNAGFTIKGEKVAWNRIDKGWENELFLQIINPDMT